MSPADDAAAKANELARYISDFFTTVDEILRAVGGGRSADDVVIGAIHEGMQDLRGKWDQLWATIQDYLAHRGDSDRLRRLADGWSAAANGVGGIANRLAPIRWWQRSSGRAALPRRTASLCRLSTTRSGR